MDTYSIIVVVGFVLAVVLGYLLGFGRVLKFITGGIVGIAISVIICVMFGGIIANIPFVADLIVRGNAYFGGIAAILEKINVATWIYYIILFLLIQIARIIIVRAIGRIFTPKDKDSKLFGVRNIINRVLGLVLMGGGFVLLVYLVMAILSLLTDVAAVNEFITNLQTNYPKSIFYLLYTHNPIDLSALF